MSDNPFKIAGALVDPDTQPLPDEQVMHQGIGFPNRPIDNVVPETFPPLDDSIAIGEPMQWMGLWQPALYYPKGSYVLDGVYGCVANVITLDRPAPAETGAPSFITPSFTSIDASNPSAVRSGYDITFTTQGFVKEVRVWTPQLTVDTTYRVYVIDITDPDNPITTTLFDPVLIENAWATVALLNQIVVAGQRFLFVVDALNSGSDTVVQGGWTAGPDKTDPDEAPPLQGWARDKHESFNFDYTDLDGGERTAELQGVTIGTTLQITQTSDTNNSWTMVVLEDPVDYGGWINFQTNREENTGNPANGQPTSCTFTIPIPQATEYAQELAGLAQPTWGTVVPLLQFNGVDQSPAADTAFGIDIEFQPATVSPDWTIVSIS